MLTVSDPEPEAVVSGSLQYVCIFSYSHYALRCEFADTRVCGIRPSATGLYSIIQLIYMPILSNIFAKNASFLRERAPYGLINITLSINLYFNLYFGGHQH